MENKLHRFKRLGVHDDWPRCFLCEEDVSSGFTLYLTDFFVSSVSVCDLCLQKARSSKIGWVTESQAKADVQKS